MIFLFWLGRIFPKIGSDRKSGKNFSHPPTPFCAPEWAALIRPWSGGSRSDQGLFFSLWSLSGETRIRIPRNFEVPGNFDHRRFSSFSFRSGISRSAIENFPTEDHEGVRFGSGGNPNDDERRRSLESFSNSSNRSVFFRSEKAEDF